MLKQQLSVFLKNNQGTLSDLTQLLGRNGVTLRAAALADTSRYGVLRAIVSDSDKALAVLQDNGYSACLTDVLCVLVPNETEGVGDALQALSSHGTDIEYLYLLREDGKCALVMGVQNPEKSMRLLESKGFQGLEG